MCGLFLGALRLLAPHGFAQPEDHANDHSVAALGQRVASQSSTVVEGLAFLFHHMNHAKPNYAGGLKDTGGHEGSGEGCCGGIVDPAQMAGRDEETIRGLNG
jgi:hypothetical protein